MAFLYVYLAQFLRIRTLWFNAFTPISIPPDPTVCCKVSYAGQHAHPTTGQQDL